jgi:hypothetical protein
MNFNSDSEAATAKYANVTNGQKGHKANALLHTQTENGMGQWQLEKLLISIQLICIVNINSIVTQRLHSPQGEGGWVAEKFV